MSLLLQDMQHACSRKETISITFGLNFVWWSGSVLLWKSAFVLFGYCCLSNIILILLLPGFELMITIETKHNRNFKGRSLMIWVTFGYLGKSLICFVIQKMDLKYYYDLLDNLFGRIWRWYGVQIEGNAAIRVYRETKKFLLRHCNGQLLVQIWTQ